MTDNARRCVGGVKISFNKTCPKCDARHNEQCRYPNTPAPTPASDEVERVARAMLAASRPNADPDELTPAPRGSFGLIPKWQLYDHLARAAIAAMRDTKGGV